MSEDMKQCPDCAEMIRGAARKCRFCGYEYPQADVPPAPETISTSAPYIETKEDVKRRNIAIIGILALFFILLIAVVKASSDNTGNVDLSVPVAEETMALETGGPSLEETIAEGKPTNGWTYNSKKDDVRNGTVSSAMLVSENQVNLNPPYGGGSAATMTIRQHPEWGLDIYFTVSPAQLLCNSYDGCSAKINIDGTTSTIAMTTPESLDHETLFVQNAHALLPKLKNAKKVIVELSAYQEGNIQFTFNTTGLEWPKK